jgi:hypothetical protein
MSASADRLSPPSRRPSGPDRQIQAEFEKKLRPVLSKIAEEDHIGILFEYPKQVIIWFAPAVDITAKVIARLDAAARDEKKQ